MKKILISILVLFMLVACGKKSENTDISDEPVIAFDGIVENESFTYEFNLDDSLTVHYSVECKAGATIVVFDKPNGDRIKEFLGSTIDGKNDIEFVVSKDVLDEADIILISLIADDDLRYDYKIETSSLDYNIKSNKYPNYNYIKIFEVKCVDNMIDNVNVNYGFNEDESVSFDATFTSKKSYQIYLRDLSTDTFNYSLGNTKKGENKYFFTLSNEQLTNTGAVALLITDGESYSDIYIYHSQLNRNVKNSDIPTGNNFSLFSIDDGKERVENFALTYAFNLDDSCTINISFDGNKGANVNVFTPPKGELYTKVLGKTIKGRNEFSFTIPKNTFEQMNDLSLLCASSFLSRTYIQILINGFDHNIKSNEYPEYDEEDLKQTNKQVSNNLFYTEIEGANIDVIDLTYKHENGEYAFNLKLNAKKAYHVFLFNAPNADIIGEELPDCIIGDNDISFSISDDDFNKVDEILLSIYIDDNERAFITLDKEYILNN